MTTLSFALTFIRAAVACTFALALASKLADPGQFLRTLHGFGVPERFTAAVMSVVVLSEAEVALGVGTGLGLTASLALAVVLLITFTAAIASILLRGRRHSCGCFGNSGRTIDRIDLLRNAGLTACAVLGLALHLGSGPASGAPPVSLGAFVGASTGLAFAILWSRLGEIADLLRAA